MRPIRRRDQAEACHNRRYAPPPPPQKGGSKYLSAPLRDVSTDPNRQDRGLLNAALTQKLTDGTDFTIGLVYAKKPQFRGEVDK